VKTSATVTEYVLALATLGEVTRNKNNPIYLAPPKVANTRTMVSVACRCHWHYCDELWKYKHSLSQANKQGDQKIGQKNCPNLEKK
jgi:hypothetical protein